MTYQQMTVTRNFPVRPSAFGQSWGIAPYASGVGTQPFMNPILKGLGAADGSGTGTTTDMSTDSGMTILHIALAGVVGGAVAGFATKSQAGAARGALGLAGAMAAVDSFQAFRSGAAPLGVGLGLAAALALVVGWNLHAAKAG
jgi:hypothetical protein